MSNLETLKHPPQYIKAIYGALAAAVAALGTVMVGSVEIGDVTQGQWVAIAGFTLAAGGGVFGLNNKGASA
jgi:hypothetical protein